ncbi:MAG: ethanolamine utilization protein [Burkholderiaceae bacterium]|nr:ethanolamine utilization protein [Sulfuritalea sp.]MCF8174006.1 ethanolamine utilization protein [Burkholderiaceae bacterium]MCF8183439.1 ethanolamine utilization protein [Polynucleobacter sp.]
MSFPALAFVDLETTGATATVDRITEIGIVEVDESGVCEWSCLVNPGVPISGFIERLTGISNAMVAQAPAFADVAAEVKARLEGRLFIAHNARFDYGFLKNEFKRAGQVFGATVLCTVKLSRKLYPQHAKHNLDSLIERHGLAVSSRHRALGDARLIHQFWQRIQVEIAPELLADTVKALTARPNLPAGLEPAMIDGLPEGLGVYLFYGENALPLYIGKSKKLKTRVLSHFAADHAAAKEMNLARQVKRIECIETAGEIGALLKEAMLIKQLQPIHNRRLRRNDELCFWKLVETGPGEWRPELARADEVEPDQQTNLYGPFKDTREARRVLTELAKPHQLCHALLGLETAKSGGSCFAYPLQQCKGACVGEDPVQSHSARLMMALSRHRLASWPFVGPALLREGDEVHLVNNWRHLGTAHSEADLHALLELSVPLFDGDNYRILLKALDRMVPLSTDRAFQP